MNRLWLGERLCVGFGGGEGVYGRMWMLNMVRIGKRVLRTLRALRDGSGAGSLGRIGVGRRGLSGLVRGLDRSCFEREG